MLFIRDLPIRHGRLGTWVPSERLCITQLKVVLIVTQNLWFVDKGSIGCHYSFKALSVTKFRLGNNRREKQLGIGASPGCLQNTVCQCILTDSRDMSYL